VAIGQYAQELVGHILLGLASDSVIQEALSYTEYLQGNDKKVMKALAAIRREGLPVTVDLLMAKSGVSAMYFSTAMELAGGAARTPHMALSAFVEAAKRAALYKHAAQAIKLLDEGESSAAVFSHLASPPPVAAPRQTINYIDRAIELIDALHEGRQQALTTGIVSLDAIFSGWSPGELTVIAAQTSIGKTAFALTIADAFARQGARVVYVTLEMEPERLIMRLAARKSGISLFRARKGLLLPEEREMYRDAIRDAGSLPIRYIYGLTRTNEVVATIARAEADVVFVDYMQLLKSPGASRYEQVGTTVRELKNASTRYNCCVVALSQLNRTASHEVKPRLGTLRDSGEIEEHANNVILLWRDPSVIGSPEVLSVIVAKQRDGMTGELSLFFEKDCQRIYEDGLVEDIIAL